ncbi:retropepsin-like aspartic protease family protein [Motilimonas pumila]|uniref:TIGR02281 family clan AA aspartic protease n=1 Tax=Motilimonas pumila TaxID=2303987 RepID=A0A418YI62_9GAMM|nr:TIGR02281 family clan AA aspartic protease [Motilimonas pumila]RJG50052.1 TIGR02281 family clan AA aspartic protease [Motilimonas pumila]
MSEPSSKETPPKPSTAATQKPQKVGKWMWLFMWLIAAALLYQYFDDKLAKQYNPNQNVSTAADGQTIILLQNRQGHYVANGFINGVEVTYLLDTGATSTVVPEKLAQRIGLKPGYASRVNTANGTINVYSTEINSLSIGSITLYDLRAQINPYMTDDTVLLGMNVLRQLKLVQQGKQLTLSL